MSFDIAKIERRLDRLEANRGASLRFGTITEVNAEAGSARVQLEDGQGMVSMPLRVLQERTLKDQRQMLPDLGEPVAVLFSGQGLEQGVILGAHYSTKTPPPGQPAKIDYTRYEDGTEFFYDREQHKLTAKIKGDAEVDSTGSIRLTAAREIALTAPRISLAGMLRVTDKDGKPGAGELLGTYRVRQGDLFVPDGDMVASSVSLVSHVHDGVEKGPDSTGKPIGARLPEEGHNDLVALEKAFETARAKLRPQTSDVEDIMLCLPDIAAAESERLAAPEQQFDKMGWLYLRSMFHRWFGGAASNAPIQNSLDDGSPFWIDWQWAMSYPRANEEYKRFIDPTTMKYQIWNEAAQKQLGDILKREERLLKPITEADFEKDTPFDFCNADWRLWETLYYALRAVPSALIEDGLQAVLAGFSLRALASGHTRPNRDGTHTITVTSVAVYLDDRFNFEKNEGLFQPLLFFWNCEKRTFDVLPSEGAILLANEEFRTFRERHGFGRDFWVLSMPHAVDGFAGDSYVYP